MNSGPVLSGARLGFWNDTYAAIERQRTQPPTSDQVRPMTSDIQTTLKERGSRYGDFPTHAAITQELKDVIAKFTPIGHRAIDGTRKQHFAPDQQEALDMICHKMGRIVNGDPDYADSWHDIAGYAQLVANRLNGNPQ